MILGLAGCLLEAAGRVQGSPAGDGAVGIGRELRELDRGVSPPRAPDRALGGAPRTDPR